MDRLTVVGQVDAVHSSAVGSSQIGLGFEKLDRDVFDPEKAYDKVAELGVKWIRIQSGWARTEKDKGVYDFAWLDSIVDNLTLRGLQPWICLCYGNALYTEKAAEVFGAVGCPPIFTDQEKDAWDNYVIALTKRYKGKVLWYEVWNEPDGLWCWKHGANGIEYGEFVKATARAIKLGDPDAKVIGGSTCINDLQWLNDAFSTGAGECMDALTYHAYSPDEAKGFNRVKALRALCHSYNPKIEIIQGETGTQSRSGGAGALQSGAWTQKRQAKFMARHMMADLFDHVKFASYFSCMDMIEALNGVVGDKESYLDYGYFGVLSADFDDEGFSTGEYTPKMSYRTLQVISSVFRESVEHVDLPVLFHSLASGRIFREEDNRSELLYGGFKKNNGSSALVYWRPAELLTTEYEATISVEVAAVEGEAALVDLLDGTVYSLPDEMVEDNGRGRRFFRHLPLRDYPLMLTFGNFT